MSVQSVAGPTGTKSPSRRRHLARAVVVAAASVAALGVGAQGASASSPITVPYHQIAVFPTWGWGGTTTVCVQDLSPSTGKVRVTPTSNPTLYDEIYAGPGQTQCIKRSWWGAPIVANNLSPAGATVKVWTY